MKFENNDDLDMNKLDDFIKEERKKYEKLTPEKKQKRLDRYYKREIEEVERIENGYYCDDCTGPICTFYQTCKRKNVGNPQ